MIDCNGHPICNARLQLYRESCHITSYKSDNCSEKCQLSLITLSKTVPGDQYLNCDCATNHFCLFNHGIALNCINKALRKTSFTCSSVEWICEQDHQCNRSLSAFKKSCSSLSEAKTCSDNCKESLSALWNSSHGFSFQKCLCDSPVCLTEKTLLQQFCFPENTLEDGKGAKIVISDYITSIGSTNESDSRSSSHPEQDTAQDATSMAEKRTNASIDRDTNYLTSLIITFIAYIFVTK